MKACQSLEGHDCTRYRPFITLNMALRRQWILMRALIAILPCAGFNACASQAKSLALEDKVMRVTIQRSGGFSGIPLTQSIDAAALSPGEADRLRQMVETADFFQLPSVIPSIPQPDRFQYRITIEQEDNTHSVTVAETAVPLKLKPLLNWVMGFSRQSGKPTP